jgi:5'-deoxynucleotidase YfbR-like HD superfamily hydrolase
MIGTVMLVRWPMKGKPGGFHFNFAREECGVIGLAVVQWAFLENALFERTKALAKRGKKRLPEDAKNFSFKRRMMTFRNLVKQVIKNNSTQHKYLQLADKIANCAQTRNKLAHGLWEFNPRQPERLLNISRSRIASFDIQAIAKFADKVKTLSVGLVYPRGERDIKPDQAYLSRGFLLKTGYKHPAGISLDDIG